jgi:hypothetical protein
MIIIIFCRRATTKYLMPIASCSLLYFVQGWYFSISRWSAFVKAQALPEKLSLQIFVCLQTNFTCIGKSSRAKHQWCMKKLFGGGGGLR